MRGAGPRQAAAHFSISGSNPKKRRDVDAHHDSLAFVLDDMARPTDFIATTKAEKLELIGRVDRLFAGCIGHCRGFAFGCHCDEFCLTTLGFQGSGRAAGQQQFTPWLASMLVYSRQIGDD